MEGQKYNNSYAQLIGNALLHMSLKQAGKIHSEKLK